MNAAPRCEDPSQVVSGAGDLGRQATAVAHGTFGLFVDDVPPARRFLAIVHETLANHQPMTVIDRQFAVYLAGI